MKSDPGAVQLTLNSTGQIKTYEENGLDREFETYTVDVYSSDAAHERYRT